MKLKKLICAALLGGAMLINGAVEAGIVTDRLPLTCYCDHRVYTYNDPNGNQVGYIDANVDLIQVTQIRSDGWAYGNYPGRNGRVSRWFRISDLCADVNYSNRSVNVNGAQRVYRTSSGGDTLGSVSNNESVIVIADNGNRAQIVYRLDNGTGYKMGWIPSSAVSTSSGRAGNGDVNGDGRVTQEDADLLLAYLRGQTQSINRANGDVNGDGDISISDVQAILKRVRENPQPAPNQIQVSLDVPLIKQTNYPHDMIGTRSIAARGCTITSLTMKYNYHNHTNMTPPEMMERLRPFAGSNGNDIVWDNVRARLGYTTDLVSNKPRLTNEWMTKIYNQLKRGNPVVIGAYNYHWVVVKGYTGTSTTNFNASDFQINDPANNFSNLQQFINKYNGGLRGIVY